MDKYTMLLDETFKWLSKLEKMDGFGIEKNNKYYETIEIINGEYVNGQDMDSYMMKYKLNDFNKAVEETNKELIRIYNKTGNDMMLRINPKIVIFKPEEEYYVMIRVRVAISADNIIILGL